MLSNRYQNGKIYKIWDNGYNVCYIGSTTEELSKRMARPKEAYKSWVRGTIKGGPSSFQLFDEFGFESCKIELLENYPCNSREELMAREGHQRENECIKE